MGPSMSQGCILITGSFREDRLALLPGRHPHSHEQSRTWGLGARASQSVTDQFAINTSLEGHPLSAEVRLAPSARTGTPLKTGINVSHRFTERSFSTHFGAQHSLLKTLFTPPCLQDGAQTPQADSQALATVWPLPAPLLPLRVPLPSPPALLSLSSAAVRFDCL